MERRKFLIGAGSLAAGAAAATGTGAFTSVSADRTISVSTADDSNALLAFQKNGNENGAYADTSGSTVSITTNPLNSNDADYDEGATGLNSDSLTRIFDMFDVVNQGTEPAVVYVDPDSIPSSARTTTSGVGVDPQATDRPNGSYDPSNDKDADEAGANLEGEISLTGIYDGPVDYTADVENFILDPGQSFEFGLYIKNPGAFDGSVPMTVIADTSLVPNDYGGT